MPEFEDISPAEYLERKHSNPDWQLLDVREPWELDIARLDGSIDVPMGEVPARLTELDRDKPVAVLCRSGGRSATIAGYLAGIIMKGRGFGLLAGGILAWSDDVDNSLEKY